ncbi:SgcJ/EcaC family oxidoreductase [Catenuloplanes atrovinosus]|uniref:Uncharacterized protein (TIGR02246 family) n=1 Tax=Catenuloplanes atrovinosus TaxID=137266 RepID=A0AAE3YTE9_9ACTN|nr:SgcJ/EcaC family oxidoreductase [Catenuloplanes atrovinosus]MDR7278326.1 uncharacterized protein (TIGR02246 family) [Catenuloplanes atrovinosus]
MESFEEAVTALHAAVLTAWNTRDAAAFAALFADGGQLVGFDGSQVPAAEIEAHLTPVFSGHATAAYVWRVREVRPLADGVALLRAIAGMLPPGADVPHPALNAVQSVVAVHTPAGWRIALLQNTPAQYHERPDLAEAHTAALVDD